VVLLQDLERGEELLPEELGAVPVKVRVARARTT
jgi:hypothetical protein